MPPGSEAIEKVYETYYTWVGEPYDDAELSGRSDYQAFILNGIPAGGLFTGAEVVKSPAQEAIWGGTAGNPFDPCYHLACDTIDNLSLHAFEVNSDLIPFAQLTFAYSTEAVNSVPGKRVPGPPLRLPAEPDGPQGTFRSSGGGHDHDHGLTESWAWSWSTSRGRETDPLDAEAPAIQPEPRTGTRVFCRIPPFW